MTERLVTHVTGVGASPGVSSPHVHLQAVRRAELFIALHALKVGGAGVRVGVVVAEWGGARGRAVVVEVLGVV